MRRHYYCIDAVDPKDVDKEPKVDVIALANTIRDVRTVMVKHLNADIANTTVNGTFRSENHACKAELKPSHKSLLSVQAVNYEIVFKQLTPLERMLVIWLRWDHAWIRSGCQIQEHID